MKYIACNTSGVYAKNAAGGLEVRKDCTIRALCNVTGKDYNRTLVEFIADGFNMKSGGQFNTFHRRYRAAGLSVFGTYGTTHAAKYFASMLRITGEPVYQQPGITLENFIKKYPVGKYILIYRGHAMAVVNGQAIDTFNSPAGKRIVLAYKYED